MGNVICSRGESPMMTSSARGRFTEPTISRVSKMAQIVAVTLIENTFH